MCQVDISNESRFINISVLKNMHFCTDGKAFLNRMFRLFLTPYGVPWRPSQDSPFPATHCIVPVLKWL